MPHRSPTAADSYTYYVLSDGELLGFNECPEDAFDDEDNKVYRLVSWHEDTLLHPGYGKRIDEVLRMFPEISDSTILDSYRVQADVTIGWLRSLNVLAGYLQKEQRVRNPDCKGMVNK